MKGGKHTSPPPADGDILSVVALLALLLDWKPENTEAK